MVWILRLREMSSLKLGFLLLSVSIWIFSSSSLHSVSWASVICSWDLEWVRRRYSEHTRIDEDFA